MGFWLGFVDFIFDFAWRRMGNGEVGRGTVFDMGTYSVAGGVFLLSADDGA